VLLEVAHLLPFALRVELRRLARLPGRLLETPRSARGFVAEGEVARFAHLLAGQRSPLRRFPGVEEALQLGKERNVALAARRLDRLVIGPHQVLSYHRIVGRPSRLRGFRPGLELHDGRPQAGIGGGCCQVSNLLYQLALHGGMRVIERHRHGLDLFEDHRRSVPFGCGATVFYNYRDLRFENPLPQPVLLRIEVVGGQLFGQLRTPEPVGFVVEVYETDHRFYRHEGQWMRENRIRRRFSRRDGTLILDQQVAHNVARVLYEPRPGAVGEPGCFIGPSARPAGARGPGLAA
jgi:vancomycin resistance protein VanW